jgi:hypothetical protein
LILPSPEGPGSSSKILPVSLVFSPASAVMATHGRSSVEKFFRVFYFIVRTCISSAVEARRKRAVGFARRFD